MMENIPFSCFINGEVPENKDILRKVTVELDRISDFYRKNYFDSYLKQGGSKIKFVTGKKGCGKTHLSRLLAYEADEAGYIVASFSANTLFLNDFTNIYKEIASNIDFEEISLNIAIGIAKSIGYETWQGDIPFLDYLANRNEVTSVIRAELREALRKTIFLNRYMDNNFKIVISLFVSSILGTISLDAARRNELYSWLNADTSLKLSLLKGFDMAPYRISKLNARYMLSSLTEFVHLGGYSGIFVVIDDLEVVASTSALSPLHYTKMRRDDTYESIRNLIDNNDSFRYIMFLFCFDSILLDNEKTGIKTYQALWLRMQNEIISKRINLYSDILDLNRFAAQYYTPDQVHKLSKKLLELYSSTNITLEELTDEEIDLIIKQANYGSISVPLLVSKAMLKLEEAKE